ncbi:DUF1565 domain-containing protein [Kineothrix sedimenti]|uniref:DUF1565 domain-containing protein n=1 Tax=Kineothrix sedimenti TaxID=3123317 RepID=A0ABZ3EVA7_9FIRM
MLFIYKYSLLAGTKNQPFRTISRAAQAARAGDTVTVHTGEYREWVKPAYRVQRHIRTRRKR